MTDGFRGFVAELPEWLRELVLGGQVPLGEVDRMRRLARGWRVAAGECGRLRQHHEHLTAHLRVTVEQTGACGVMAMKSAELVGASLGEGALFYARVAQQLEEWADEVEKVQVKALIVVGLVLWAGLGGPATQIAAARRAASEIAVLWRGLIMATETVGAVGAAARAGLLVRALGFGVAQGTVDLMVQIAQPTRRSVDWASVAADAAAGVGAALGAGTGVRLVKESVASAMRVLKPAVGGVMGALGGVGGAGLVTGQWDVGGAPLANGLLLGAAASARALADPPVRTAAAGSGMRSTFPVVEHFPGRGRGRGRGDAVRLARLAADESLARLWELSSRPGVELVGRDGNGSVRGGDGGLSVSASGGGSPSGGTGFEIGDRRGDWPIGDDYGGVRRWTTAELVDGIRPRSGPFGAVASGMRGIADVSHAPGTRSGPLLAGPVSNGSGATVLQRGSGGSEAISLRASHESAPDGSVAKPVVADIVPERIRAVPIKWAVVVDPASQHAVWAGAAEGRGPEPGRPPDLSEQDADVVRSAITERAVPGPGAGRPHTDALALARPAWTPDPPQVPELGDPPNPQPMPEDPEPLVVSTNSALDDVPPGWLEPDPDRPGAPDDPTTPPRFDPTSFGPSVGEPLWEPDDPTRIDAEPRTPTTEKLVLTPYSLPSRMLVAQEEPGTGDAESQAHTHPSEVTDVSDAGRPIEIDAGVLALNGVQLDPAARRVLVDGNEIELSVRQFDLLEQLMKNAGSYLPRVPEFRKLQHKIDDDERGRPRLTSVRGYGIRFERGGSTAVSEDPVLTVGHIELDSLQFAVFVHRRHMPLSRLRFGVLEYLMRRAGQNVSVDEILRAVWTDGEQVNKANLVTVVKRLRRQLGDHDATLIQTVADGGYRLEPDRAKALAAGARPMLEADAHLERGHDPESEAGRRHLTLPETSGPQTPNMPLTHGESAALVVAAHAGDPSALTRLWGRYKESVFRQALGTSNDRAVAEQIVAETLEAASDALESLRDGTDVGEWFAAIAARVTGFVMFRHRMWSAFARGAGISESDPRSRALAVVPARTMKEALSNLPDDVADYLRLRFWGAGMSVEEMSERMGKPADYVAALEAGAIRELANALAPSQAPSPKDVSALEDRILLPAAEIAARGVQLVRAGRRVTVRGTEVGLSLREFKLLWLFVERSGRLLPQDEILPELGFDAEGGARRLSTLVSQLRAKIGGAHPEVAEYIIGVRSAGYGFAVGQGVLKFAEFEMDVAGRQAWVRGVALELGHKESELLGILMEGAGEPVPHRDIQIRIWGSEERIPADPNSLRVLVSRLRRKVAELDRHAAARIATVRGVGHQLLADSVDAKNQSMEPGKPSDDEPNLRASTAAIPISGTSPVDL